MLSETISNVVVESVVFPSYEVRIDAGIYVFVSHPYDRPKESWYEPPLLFTCVQNLITYRPPPLFDLRTG